MYFFRFQGEVEQISLMKPKARNENEEGMLEYLEDIIGSSRLKAPIFRLHQRLETINDQRANQLKRLNFADKQKAELEEPAKKVFIQMRLENAIASVKNRMLAANKFILLFFILLNYVYILELHLMIRLHLYKIKMKLSNGSLVSSNQI